MKRSVRVSGVCLASVTAILITSGGTGAATAADEQPPLVEDYAYPGADKIFADYGVRLISGDGHLVLADCSTAPTADIGLVKVRTTEIDLGKRGLICFQVLGAAGRLSLKIPAVYEIRNDGLRQGKGHALHAELTTDTGTHTTIDIEPAGTARPGWGTNATNAPTTLLTLEATS